jgi:hypothetical protein
VKKEEGQMFNSDVIVKTTQNQFLKRALFIALIIYSVITTIGVVKLSPKPIVIAVEDGETKIVSSEDDKILLKEKVNFLKRVISKLYTYDSSSYVSQVSEAGDYMTVDLWKQKESEYLKIAEKLKDEELTQKVKILDLREVSPEHFQADIEIYLKHRLQEKKDRITVDFKVRRSKRDLMNPYNMELTDYVENAM